jgi:LmbE family N-acetylglucosaminyl deacetylase
MIRAGDVLDRMQQLPLAGVDEIAPRTSLILAPHPDDETLGCGGLIASLCERGRPPVIVAVTDGTGSHPGSASYPPARLKAVREAELRCAAAILGLDERRVLFLGLPDTRVPQDGPCFDRAVRRIANVVRAHDVATIFVTWTHDPHCDHQATARIAAAAALLTEARLMLYPVWGRLLARDQTLPAVQVAGARLDIRAQLPRKRRAVAAHATQYSDLIADDPNAFRLPSELLAAFDQPFEVFLDA